jgi:membrane protease YdiL (CAAX protease family)
LNRFYRLAAVFYLVLALGGGLWIGLARRGPIPLRLFLDLHPAHLALDLALGVAAGLLLVGVWRLGKRYLPAARELNDQLAQLLGGMSPADAVALALISGFAEELFFRGAVQSAWGWIPATILFAALHTGPGRAFKLWTLFALLAGLLFAALVLWRGNLLPAILAHVLVNAVNLTALALEGAGRESVRESPPHP